MAWRQILRKARVSLEDAKRGTDQRKRLQIAGRVFWRAMLYLERWPSPCQDEAKAITATLLADGLIHQTIEAMNEVEVAEVSERLRMFCKRMAELPLQPDEDTDGCSRIAGPRELQPAP